jgi:hypothetical protein
MQGRIVIEYDFDKKVPHINFMAPKDSSDLRDRMMKHFLEKLGHSSSWCKIKFTNWGGSDNTVCLIRAISPEELREEAKIMLEQAELMEQYPKQDSVSH